jgi:dipeptidyl aminopeptidase/acylaminoacyl peptidase
MSTGPQERVSFSNDRGETLSAIVHYPASGKLSKGAILCHGMESNKESDKIVALGQALAERGVLVLRFDFSYAGESSGRFEDITYSGEVKDLEASFEFIRGYQVEKIAILGSSMGGTVALLFAAQQKSLACLVTVAAPLHPERFPEKLLSPAEVTLWREQGHISYHGQRLNVSLLDDLGRINVPEAAKKVSHPLLIVHGDNDEIVPVDEAYELYALVGGSKRLCILPGGDHRFSNPSLLKKAVDESIAWMTLHLQ